MSVSTRIRRFFIMFPVHEFSGEQVAAVTGAWFVYPRLYRLVNEGFLTSRMIVKGRVFRRRRKANNTGMDRE